MNRLDNLINLIKNSEKINCMVQICCNEDSKFYTVNIDDIYFGENHIAVPITEFDYLFLDIEKCNILQENSIAEFVYPNSYIKIFF